MKKDVYLHMRVTKEELFNWQDAAEKSGVKFNDWVRDKLNARLAVPVRNADEFEGPRDVLKTKEDVERHLGIAKKVSPVPEPDFVDVVQEPYLD
jgi:hypothetical protein